MSHDPLAELRARVTESRVAQGLPPTVEDVATLQKVADIFRTAPAQDAPRAEHRVA